MTIRHIVLASAAVLVLGVCVYLFLEVRKPASAQASSGNGPTVAHHESDGETIEPGEPGKPDKPAGRAPTVVRPSAGIGKPTVGDAITNPQLTEPPVVDVEDGRTAVKLDALMAEANKAYDRLDLDDARAYAQKVLAKQPTNARMLRIMVSAACIENDGPEAQKHYNLLPQQDREQMKTRCARYNVTFTDPLPSPAPSVAPIPATK